MRKGGNLNSNKSDGAKRKYDVPEGKIPSIPGYILYKIKPDDVRKDLIRWRVIYNDEKRAIRIDELQRNSRHEYRNNSYAKTEASQESPMPKRRLKDNINIRVKTARKTTVKNSGLANQTVRVSMKDEDDDSESDHSDESTSSKSEEASQRNTSKVRSLTRKKNGRKNGSNGRDHGTKRKCGQARRGTNDVINSHVAPRMIIDPGTEIDVIGGVRWFILNVVDGTTANLGGALAGMGE